MIRVIESFESGMRVLALITAPRTGLGIEVLALLRQVIVAVGGSPVVKGLVGVHAGVPVVVLRFVRAVGCLIAVHVKENGIYRSQVGFHPFLER